MVRPRVGKNIDKVMSQDLDLEQPIKIRNNCKLTRSWVWDKRVNDFARERIKGYSLNICAGLSDVGDVKLDLDPQNSKVGMADMNNIPYPDNTFDTVISDPPWKIGFFQRMKPFFEAVRVCKVGGTIIYNCTWKPISKVVSLEEAVIRTDNNWANVSVIYVFKKIGNINEKNSSNNDTLTKPTKRKTKA